MSSQIKQMSIQEENSFEDPSLDFLKRILDNLPIAIFCKDASNDFRFVLWNRSAEDLWGLKAQNVLGKSDRDFFPEKEFQFFRSKDLEVMKLGRVLEIPEESVTSNGKVTYVHTVKVPLNDAQGYPKYLLGISRDIGEEKKMKHEMDLQRMKGIASAKLLSLGQMASNVGHEINNPVSIILGRVNVLKKALEKLNIKKEDGETIDKSLHSIHVAAHRITTIVNGLKLLGTHSENDPLEELNLINIVDASLELSKKRFENLGAKITVNVDPNIKMVCREAQIAQVIHALLMNSMDAVEPLAKKWIEINAKELGDKIQIEVIDSGNSIPQPIAEKLMTPFFSGKPFGKGMGLGLSTSKGIIDNHGGNFYFDPSSSHTRFVIELPKKGFEKK